jgi:DNA-binding transcriptional ArsR family regulator
VAAYVTAAWTALGDPTRRVIFERLVEGPQAVGKLAGELPVSRPAVSQHLKVLKDAGLVVDRPAGKQRIYQVEREGLEALRAELDRFWTKTLAAYKEVVEQPTKEDPDR